MLSDETGNAMSGQPPTSPVPGVGAPTRPKRRRLRLVLIAVGGVIVAMVVALVGIVGFTAVAADQGAPDPNTAALKVLIALDQWQELSDADHYLCDEDMEAMHARLADLRRHFETVLTSYAVVTKESEVVLHGDREATVTTTMGVNWMPPGSMAYRGEPLPWTFHVKRVAFPSGGWKVCAFESPQPCDYVNCD